MEGEAGSTAREGIAAIEPRIGGVVRSEKCGPELLPDLVGTLPFVERVVLAGIGRAFAPAATILRMQGWRYFLGGAGGAARTVG